MTDNTTAASPGHGLNDDGLNERQRLFVQEYLVDLNATQAAIRAGYSEASAASQAAELLKVPKIESAVAAAKAERFKRIHMSADEVLSDLAEISRTNLSDVAQWSEDGGLSVKPSSELTPAQAKAIKKVRMRRTERTERGGAVNVQTEMEVELHDQVRTRELIGRHAGIFEKTVTVPMPSEGGSTTVIFTAPPAVVPAPAVPVTPATPTP